MTEPKKTGKRAFFARYWRKLLLFFAIMGPGIITANVDNDAGGLATYSQAGAAFGYDMLWIFIPVTVALVLIQEMVNRMGVVTGEGLSSLIRARFGVKITFYLMLILLATNFGNVVAEFAGIAAASGLFGIPSWISVPICALLVWAMVVRGTYRSVEKIFLAACIFYLAYIVTAFIVGPDMGEVGMALVTPTWVPNQEYTVLVVGLIGTTIAPWMQFYQQASVVEKNIRIEEYGYSRADTIIGCILVSVVAMAIVVVCSLTLHQAGILVNTADEAARALTPLAGVHATQLFAFGLWNASMFAASILPLSTAYTVCEALGWERGVDKSYSEAPQFYSLYTFSIVLGALLVLVSNVSPIRIMVFSQVLNGFLLPVILVFMLILINDPKVMGQYVNGKLVNIISVIIVAAVSIISLLSIYYIIT